MSSSESAGRSQSERPSRETAESRSGLKKDRVIGLGIIAVAFLFALGASSYSAKTVNERNNAATEPAP